MSSAAHECCECMEKMPKKQRESLSVAREIFDMEEKLFQCRQCLEEVDFKLRTEDLTHEESNTLEEERNLLTIQAESYEKELKVLRQENCKNAVLSVAFVLLVIVIYIWWTI